MQAKVDSGIILTFQFHKGAIRTGLLIELYNFLINFNSIKVRLELLMPATFSPTTQDFNSIKVRLELIREYTIFFIRQFQFHKGAIRTWLRLIACCALFYFNSIKVRLEHSRKTTNILFSTFQFHKGAIRTKILIICYEHFPISIP